MNRVKFRSACVLKALASGASALAIVSAFTVAASAQQAPAIVPDTAEEVAPSPIDQGAQAGTVAPSGDVANANADADIVVTGVRASLRSAQARKRNASQIIDSIVAEDIGKLPDNNVSEALQRISGIQIERNQGEGSRIAIRGLTQVRTELNGRDYFTAGDGRTISLEDIPSELLAGIDVYKNPAADVIEGGLGGTVNLRTRMPFDFSKPTISGSARVTHHDLADKTKTSFSGLITDTYQTGLGEIGFLLNGSLQRGAIAPMPCRSSPISCAPASSIGPAMAARLMPPTR
ncbi:TonB-dependent receptor plug domain-containing protein [Sphingomonas sp. Ant20]|uniref:TonB-dependent receptor plug domain-containing protein n=1 Tax=Sphingomonas sp. Ant20 TaxID=104605 RepID=UPI0012FEA1AB|nr:TonB-dependent receptor plug domain-containing protein [Sphingomonas sp. Ant20]